MELQSENCGKTTWNLQETFSIIRKHHDIREETDAQGKAINFPNIRNKSVIVFLCLLCEKASLGNISYVIRKVSSVRCYCCVRNVVMLVNRDTHNIYIIYNNIYTNTKYIVMNWNGMENISRYGINHSYKL